MMGAKARFINNLNKYQLETAEDGAWHLPLGITVQEVITQSGIEKSGVEDFGYLVNGSTVFRSYALKDGDELVFMSAFVGG